MKTSLRIGVFLKTLISVFFVVFLLSTTTALAQLTFGPDIPAVNVTAPSVPLTFGPDVGLTPIAPTDPALYPLGTPVTPGGGNTGETVTIDGVTYNTGAPAPEPELPIIIGDGFLNSLYGFVLVFGGKLVYWAGELLNWVVDSFVIGFGDIYLTWGIGFAVEAGWKIIRDVLNLSFIFAIVYIGIRLIFDADDSSAKRSLGYLIAAALLINFSLFISKFVIDFSNSLASIIYTTGLEGARADIGSAFINVLGLSTIIKVNLNTIDIGNDTAVGLSIIFGTFIFMLTATYALAAGAFLMFARGIMLIFFMIFSPIMFLGWIFPQFKSFTSKYWSMFLSNAFMAPAFLFCIYLTFTIMSGFKYQVKTEGTGSLGNLFSQEDTANGIRALIVFTLTIGMMLASISIAKRMGAFGGGLVVSVGDSLMKRGKVILGGATAGLAARGLRSTVGAGANYLSKTEGMRKFASTGTVGKTVYNATRKTADASFDVRQVAGVGKSLGIGQGKKGGFTTRLKEKERAESEFLDSLGKRSDEETKPERDAVTVATHNLNARKTQLKNDIATLTALERDRIKTLTKEYKTASKERKEAIANEINAMQNVITTKSAELTENAQAEIDTLTKILETANTNLIKSQYKYQIQYNENIQNWNKKFGKAMVLGTAGVTGILTGGVVPAIATGAIATGYMYNSKKINESMINEYGADGTMKKQKKQEKERIQSLVEALEKEVKNNDSKKNES